jgi:excisionase family DNA binding protein
LETATATLATPKAAPPFMNKREAADYLRISERTLNRYLEEEKVRCLKYGRKCVFSLEELNRFAAAQQV